MHDVLLVLASSDDCWTLVYLSSMCVWLCHTYWNYWRRRGKNETRVCIVGMSVFDNDNDNDDDGTTVTIADEHPLKRRWQRRICHWLLPLHLFRLFCGVISVAWKWWSHHNRRRRMMMILFPKTIEWSVICSHRLSLFLFLHSLIPAIQSQHINNKS